VTEIPFVKEFSFAYGEPARLSPLIRRVVANNPGPFTYTGTGTYIIGGDGAQAVAVIDPGPDDDAHLGALTAAIGAARVSHILVTHTHRDHCAGARRFAERTGAPVLAAGPHPVKHAACAAPALDEGADYAFRPDRRIADGEIIQGDGWTIEAVATPGHLSNHLCFALRKEKALFTGDHIMGWSTSIISPPDGDMAAYMASLELLLERDDEVYWPTHGPRIDNPKELVRAFIEHRHEREAQIRKCIAKGVHRIRDMVPIMYTSTPEFMYPAAARSVLAAVEYMVKKGEIVADGAIDLDTTYHLS
jgi:glyoxylase-like metal-dependent hydrolase (beta-lactamase superfamily II)